MDMRHSRRAHLAGHSLIEVLVTVAILALLASLTLPVIARAYSRAKLRIVQVWLFHDARSRALSVDDIPPERMLYYLTNSPRKFMPDEYAEPLTKQLPWKR